MRVFAKLRQVRAFERKHLQFLETVEDFDLMREVGFHQEQGTLLTMKQLYLLGLGSVATVQRRLRRLKDLGAVVPRRTESDARAVELTVHPRVLKLFAKYAELLGVSES